MGLNKLNNKSILVFDSGMGGMTVSKAIRADYPDIKQLYLADNAAFPYGLMSMSSLHLRVNLLISEIIEKYHLDAIVIACNTASTIVLDELRSQIDIPIIGVVPAIKTAGEKSKTRSICLLSTVATSEREYIDDLIEKFAPDCQVNRLAVPELALIAEKKIRGVKVDLNWVKDALKSILAKDDNAIDMIVLGCTHYPLLLDEFKKLSPDDICWIDNSPAISKRLGYILEDNNDNNKANKLNNWKDVTDYLGDPSKSKKAKIENVKTEKTKLSKNILYFTKEEKDNDELFDFIKENHFSEILTWNK